jgi:hypothetical protein
MDVILCIQKNKNKNKVIYHARFVTEERVTVE